MVLLDTEGEYVKIGEPTDDTAMVAALERRGMAPAGVPNTHLLHLVGTDTAYPDHPHRTEFGLSFSALSPYTVAEIVNMSEAQQERFLRTVDVAKQVLRDLKIFPKTPQEERRIWELNEFDEGYPTLTLSKIIDLASVFLAVADNASTDATWDVAARLADQLTAAVTERDDLRGQQDWLTAPNHRLTADAERQRQRGGRREDRRAPERPHPDRCPR